MLKTLLKFGPGQTCSIYLLLMENFFFEGIMSNPRKYYVVWLSGSVHSTTTSY